MNENIKKNILESKSRRDASLKIFGYNNNCTLKKVDEYIKELNHVFLKNKNTKYCKYCGKEIRNSNIFCNKSCAASFNNKMW